MSLPVIQLKCGTSGDAVPTMLLKCGTQANAVPTLLRACPGGEIVPPVSCLPCSGTAPSWIYVTLTVPGGYQELCLPDINGRCTDRACVHIWSTGERVKIPITPPFPSLPCFYRALTSAGITYSYKRTYRTEANCDAYEDIMGGWYDPCDHTGSTLFPLWEVFLGWSAGDTWSLGLANDYPQGGYGYGRGGGSVVIPQCTPGIYTFVADFVVAFQGGLDLCDAGPIPITATVEFPEVG